MTGVALEPVSVVIAGCGAVTKLFYAPALAHLEDCGLVKVAALVDPHDSNRRTIQSHFHEAIGVAKLDHAPLVKGTLVIIASPPGLHAAQSIHALERGATVLCEKPMAATSAETQSMLDATVRTGQFLAIGHYKRFMPAHRAVKHFIVHQTFGSLREVEIAEGGKFGWPATSDSFFRKEQTSGGVLLDIGVHVLDLLLWWLGEPTTFTYADDARDGLEANCLLTAEFPQRGLTDMSPVSIRVQLSRDWATPNCYVFRFERATVHCRVNASNQLELTLDGLPMTFAAELRDPLPPQPAPSTSALETNAQAFIAQLVDVCAAIREHRAPLITGEDGARVIRLIERCYATRKSIQQPWLAPIAGCI